MKQSRLNCLYGIVIFLAAEAIQMVVAGILGTIYALLEVFHVIKEKGGGSLADSTELASKMQDALTKNLIYLIGVVGVIVCGIVFFFWYKREIKGEARGKLKNLFTLKHILLLLLIGVGCQFFITGIMNIIQKYFSRLFANYEEQIKLLTDGNIVIVLLLMIIFAPITEELIFRGMILHKANRYIPFVWANLLQAVLFGIYHMNIVQGIYAAFLGFLLGTVYYKFKTIVASMFLHMVINASSLLVALFPDSRLYYIIYILTGGAVLAAAIILLKPWERLVPVQTETEYDI
jgi:membrane protease YdiL (CAAX protease family)